MLSLAAIFAAFSIAGAFWVGVLAARRIRDFGEGRRALEHARSPLALAAAAAHEGDAAEVREVLARKIAEVGLLEAGAPASSAGRDADVREAADLRVGDVVSVEAADPDLDGDFLVQYVVLLREGSQRHVIAGLEDGTAVRCLVAESASPSVFIGTPVDDPGFAGEPPRQISVASGLFSLVRRRQAGAAGAGPHGRPDLSRMTLYRYETFDGRVAMVERWGRRVLVTVGRDVPAHMVSFLPGA